ncbi:MAG: hypothetical protein RR490_08030, partial [Niameybacter sp.]
MKKNKKLLIRGGAILTGVFVGLPLGLQSVYAGVQQVTSQEVKDIHNKLEHLRESLKKNYLTVKNIPIWDQYIQEAKKLLERLPEGSSKEKYEERITDAEVLLVAIARVSKLEESVEANADIIGNVKVWEKYIELGKKDLGNVDKEAFKSHYNNLLERLALKNKVVEEVKVEYTQKVEALNDAYKKAEELAKTDPAKALQLLKDALDKAGKLDADGLKDKLMEAVKEAIGNIKVPETPVPPSGGGGGGTPPPPPPPVVESPYIIEGNNVTVKPGFNNLTINSAALGISTVGLLTLPSGTNVTIDGLVVQGVIVTQGVLQTAG